MQEFSTPMMKQYMEIKEQYKDCLLFFRMGDFYELFLDDAYVGAQVLNITLTSRPKGKDGRIPMAGIPYHAVDSYLNKLVQAGYKVAICEQVSLPNKYGLVDREVIRVVTPGTVLDEKALEKKSNNYLIALSIDGQSLAISATDISTGYFATTEIIFQSLEQTIKDELSKLNPSECILPESLYNNPDILKILKQEPNLNIYPFLEWDQYSTRAKDVLKEHFGISTLEVFGLEDKTLARESAAALLGYLKQTQKSTVSHIKKIVSLSKEKHLVLDRSTIINLELFSTIREHNTKGSLLFVLDQTNTAMGGRLLKDWICKPLNDYEEINKRHEVVNYFYDNYSNTESLRQKLEEVTDIERLLSRLSVGLGNPRDLINLKTSLQTILEIKKSLQSEKLPKLLKSLVTELNNDIKTIIRLVEQNIADEPPISLREGNIFKTEVDKELDELRKVVSGNKSWIQELEKDEREKTGIASLKVRFNSVFGFYIEISKSNLHLVPENYLRKQTLVNGERFITPELKEKEEIILSAQERINEKEYQMFLKLLEEILGYTKELQDCANSIATIDCLLNFAYLAKINNYVKPTILYSGEMEIKNGRHPVVEKLLEETLFVPNDLNLDNISQQVLLITGPNMAGKSVYIRQVGLIVLMAQIGSFVPADSAKLSIVDRIFVRSGASDVITSGLSTFMVEMVETAHILHNATKNSLIIMDEIGRGTSTYDGISIAWAVAEFLASNFKTPPKTLFATHYHELQALEKHFPTHIKNYHMEVESDNDAPIFLHTIKKGGASSSFGVAVAKLAGIPDPVIKKAEQILAELEKRNLEESEEKKELIPELSSNNLSDLSYLEDLLLSDLEEIDIHSMTPLDALNKLAELKDKYRLIHTPIQKSPLEIN